MTGYIVGHADDIFPLQAMVLRTLDGGSSWTSMLLPTDNKLYSLFFTDDNAGYVVGSGGSILKTTSGTYVSIDEDRSRVPGFTLFPNPSGNLITIERNTKIDENILVKIYNMAGKQMTNEKFHDQVTIRIDIHDLAKGVYVVMIETDSGTEAKKLIKH